MNSAGAMALPGRIYLLGFMGSGKSTVAPILAGFLGYGWIDLDAAVEAAAGMTVREIFGKQGEPAFRSLERAELLATGSSDSVVVAAGGGAVVTEEAWEFVRSAGTSVWLRADLDAMLARLGEGASRPMLGDGDVRVRAEKLLREREPFYRRADVVVDVLPGDPATTAALVAEALRRRASGR